MVLFYFLPDWDCAPRPCVSRRSRPLAGIWKRLLLACWMPFRRETYFFFFFISLLVFHRNVPLVCFKASSTFACRNFSFCIQESRVFLFLFINMFLRHAVGRLIACQSCYLWFNFWRSRSSTKKKKSTKM